MAATSKGPGVKADEQPKGADPAAPEEPKDSPNADAVPPTGDEELVRIDPAQNFRPPAVARAGRHPGGVTEPMSREDLAEAREEMAELRARMAKLEERIGTGVARRTFLMSEGVRQDVELHGTATDPATGETFTREDLDRIPEGR